MNIREKLENEKREWAKLFNEANTKENYNDPRILEKLIGRMLLEGAVIMRNHINSCANELH